MYSVFSLRFICFDVYTRLFFCFVLNVNKNLKNLNDDNITARSWEVGTSILKRPEVG